MKRKKINNQGEFDLNQKEVHLFGELLLHKISLQYQGLITEADYIWTLEDDIKLLSKLADIIVRLSNNKRLIEG